MTILSKPVILSRMEYALIYVIVAILAGAFTGAAVTTWSLRLSILRLETNVDGLAERLAALSGRELAKARWSKRDQEQALLLSQMQKNSQQPNMPYNPFVFPG